MRIRKPVFEVALLMGLLLAGAAFGGEAGTSSHRMNRRAGMYLSYGDPYPTVIGVNAAYSVTDFLKAQLGFGKISVASGIDFTTGAVTEASATTIGLGVKGMVPGWNFTPTVGLHWAHVSYSGAGLLKVGGFQDSGSHVYGSLGFDWQTAAEFNLTGGYQFSFKSGIGGGVYLGAGWFVDWLG